MPQAQAAWLAYIDTIWIYGLGCLAVVLLAFSAYTEARIGAAMGAH